MRGESRKPVELGHRLRIVLEHDVRQLIRRLAGEKCMVVSTHILEEVDAICSRIVIINRGRILEDSTPDALRKREGGTLQPNRNS